MKSDQDKTATAKAFDRHSLPLGNRQTGLFRTESMQRHSNQWLGKTTLAVPLSFRYYSLSAIFLLVAIGAYLFFGSYAATERFAATIIPEAGLTKVYGPTGGRIAAKYVKGGERVTAGTPLVAYRPKESDGLPVFERLAQANTPGPDATAMERIDVKAPINGTLYQIEQEIGDEFMDFAPVATIAPDGPLAATAVVSANVHAQIRIGTPVTLELTALKNRPNGMLTGHVTEIAIAPTSQRDPTTNVPSNGYKVVVRLTSTSTALTREELLGKSVVIKLPVEKRRLYQWFLDPIKVLFGR